MNKRIFFHEMDRSLALENYADGLLANIITFLEHEREPIYLDLILEAGRPHAHHRVELRIKSPHYDLIAHDEGPEIYKLLNEVVDTMYYKLRERKKELVDDARNKDWYKGC